MQKKLIIFMPSIEGGGVEKNLFIISNFLSKKINNIILITASYHYNKYFNKKIKIINPKVKFWDLCGRKAKYLICLYILFKEIIKTKKILIFAFQANIYCIILAKIFNVKIITRSNSSPSGWSKNFFKKILYKIILRLSNKIIVNSLEFKKEMKKKFFINAKCIYNPLNTKEIKILAKEKIKFNFLKKKKNCINILNVGRFVEQKDHFTLLKALNFISHKINFKALIVGKGINKNKMTEYIRSKQLNKKIKIINFQKNPYKYMNLCDVFILSSIYEGLPNVLLEAITLKKFVISSSCPTGPKEILSNGKGGFLFNPGNYKLLAKKIEIFYLNQKKLKNKSEYAYKKLYRFDYKNNLNEYLKIILKYL